MKHLSDITKPEFEPGYYKSVAKYVYCDIAKY